MGLSVYMLAENYMSETFDNDLYHTIVGNDLLPLDVGARHNANPSFTVSLALATWHKQHEIMDYLFNYCPNDSDEFQMDLDRDSVHEIILDARKRADYPTDYYPDCDADWVTMGFTRLERALSDYLIDPRFEGWTLKVWRSY